MQTSTYGRAFWVGLLNTLLIAVLGIVLATILGFLIGIARLSRNWLLANVARAYVEFVRNIPLLLQLLLWYNAVLKALPDIRQISRSLALRCSTIAACFSRSRVLVQASRGPRSPALRHSRSRSSGASSRNDGSSAPAAYCRSCCPGRCW